MSKIRIHKYEDKYREEWENFVETSNNGTMFHKQSFLDYHSAGKFNFHNLMFRCGDELIGVLPGGLSDNNQVFWSPTGASYGSIVTQDAPYELCQDLIDALLDYSKEQNYREIFLIPPPIIYNKVYNQHIEYAMMYRRFDYELHYISHAIHLIKGENYFDKVDAKAQKIVKKIIKDGKLRIEESQDYEAFYPILEKNKARFKVKPTHSLEDLYKLRELMPEQLKLFMIYYDDIPIAGSLLFLANSKVALCFYIMLLYEYKHLKPVFLGLNEITRWAQENGYEWMDIGVSQDTAAEDPMTPSLNLIYFKERFHARGILRSTFHYKFRD